MALESDLNHHNESIADEWLRYEEEEIGNTRNEIINNRHWARRHILRGYARHVYGMNGDPTTPKCYPLADLIWSYGKGPLEAAFNDLDSILIRSTKEEVKEPWWTLRVSKPAFVCFQHRDFLKPVKSDE